MNAARIPVSTSTANYDVVIGENVRFELASLIARVAPSAERAVLLSSPSLRACRWWGDLSTGLETVEVILPDGEAAKNWMTAGNALEAVAEAGLSRRDVIVAVGGGAVTDLAGFVAATYLRGVAAIYVSTSLAGQVDAAIGGKTGLNLRAGKNLAGAFHQPAGVLCDVDILDTLPERERRSGYGEIAKCWRLLGHRESLVDRPLLELVQLSVRLKAEVVAEDEFESGRRALLNYGHTLGHAIEAWGLGHTDDALLHGEAVAIGMVFADRLAERLGRVPSGYADDTAKMLTELSLPTSVPADADGTTLLDYMFHDKKAHHDLTFVLAGPSGYEVVRGVSPQLVLATIEETKERP